MLIFANFVQKNLSLSDHIYKRWMWQNMKYNFCFEHFKSLESFESNIELEGIWPRNWPLAKIDKS